MTQVERAMGLWQHRNVAEDANDKLEHRRLIQQVGTLVKSMEQAGQRIATLEARLEANERMVHEMCDRVYAAEGEDGKHRAELVALQRAVEMVTVGLTRENQQIVECESKLSLLAQQQQRLREGPEGNDEATVWALASYMYVPLLHFIKGFWVVLVPILSTFRNLTLLNPSVAKEDQVEEGNDIDGLFGGDDSVRNGLMNGKGSHGTGGAAARGGTATGVANGNGVGGSSARRVRGKNLFDALQTGMLDKQLAPSKQKK